MNIFNVTFFILQYNLTKGVSCVTLSLALVPRNVSQYTLGLEVALELYLRHFMEQIQPDYEYECCNVFCSSI